MRGPTRPVALIRIGLALILWLTWGDRFLLYRNGSLETVAVAIAFYGTTTAMLVGAFSRLSSLAASAVGFYIYYKLGVVDGVDAFVHHHTLLMVLATALLALAPCGDALSVDRYLAQRRGEPGRDVADLWSLRLLALLASAVYLGGAASKTNGGWLSGDRLEQIFAAFYGGSIYYDSAVVHLAFQLMTIGVVALEWTLAFGLWFRKTRRILWPAGVLLHFGFYVLLPVESFSLTMVLLYIAFAPASVDSVLERVLAPSSR